MLPTPAEAGLLTLSFAVPLLFVFISMPGYLKYLVRLGRVVKDVHKQPPVEVPSPAGPLLFAGALVGEVVASLTFGSMVPVAVVGAAGVAFAVGVTDDLFVLGGKTKPLLLLLAAVPLILSAMVQPDIYLPQLTFPLFGPTSAHFIIYTLLAVAGFPVVSNAFNMMDSFNGEISGFTLVVSLALLFAVLLHALSTDGFSLARVAATLPLVAVAAGFLFFNRYPSKAFDGDSGSLMFGAMFAALAVTGGIEVAAVIAIVPAILNSFYILSSVRGFVERRKMGARPTYAGDDGRLYASQEKSAPTTLVRMILLDGPLTENELVRSILLLTVASCILSGITSLLTWVI